MSQSLLRRVALALGLAVAASGSLAECRGLSILHGLDEAKRADLAAAVAVTPYGEGILRSALRGAARILIAGTMHLPDPRHGDLLEAIRPAIRDADLVLLEATPAEETTMAQAITDVPRWHCSTAPPCPNASRPRPGRLPPRPQRLAACPPRRRPASAPGS